MGSPIDGRAFAKLRRIAPNRLEAHRQPDEWRARPLPEEISFKLTNRCDLRCSHCYHWGDDGYHRRLPDAEAKSDLSLTVIAKVLDATRAVGSNVFLSGGEPLLYGAWDALVELLAADPRWVSVCTNGTLIERRFDSFARLGSRLELSVSLDGFAAEHDGLRGQGTFDRTLAGLRALVRGKQSGRYQGEVSVNCVIGDAMVSRLHDYVAFVEAEGVETLYLSLPWYISGAATRAMQGYTAEHFPELAELPHPSWQSFGFRIASEQLDVLCSELARVMQASWRLKLRFNPKLAPEELADFLAGSDRPMQGKTRCLALRTRLDVFPNADVVACKFFPEFTVGNLERAELSEVWHGAAFDRVRETVARCGLMPVCAKCNLLYARGA